MLTIYRLYIYTYVKLFRSASKANISGKNPAVSCMNPDAFLLMAWKPICYGEYKRISYYVSYKQERNRTTSYRGMTRKCFPLSEEFRNRRPSA